MSQFADKLAAARQKAELAYKAEVAALEAEEAERQAREEAEKREREAVERRKVEAQHAAATKAAGRAMAEAAEKAGRPSKPKGKGKRKAPEESEEEEEGPARVGACTPCTRANSACVPNE